jgi:hypothetical protein
MMPSSFHSNGLLVIACLILFGLIISVSAYPHGNTVHVNSGQSIQAAIDSCHGGDKIVVEDGNYTEQLTITRDGLTLIGHNAIILPPATPITNNCTELAGPGTQAGICVSGSGIVYVDEPFDGEHKKVQSVADPVKDTTIKGFTVKGFSGLNIAVLGAKDASVSENTVNDGPQYGMLTVGSKNTEFKRNVVASAAGGFIGVCMDDKSTVTIAQNDISTYYIGICVQTAGADIHDNVVHDNCIGAFVDPNINGAKLQNNIFTNTPAVCNPDFGVGGIIISGGTNTVVKGNSFSNIKNSGKAAGVAIVDDPSGAVASGNDVEKNTFKMNDLDIYVQTTGKGNVVKKNACSSSVPADLCPGK